MADKVKKMTQYRIDQIELAEAKYYETLIRTLDKIEDEIISLAGRELPTQQGKLFNLKVSLAVRPKIKSILDREYLKWSDTVVREGFNKQAKRIERAFKTIGRIPKEFQTLTESDLALIQNLKQQYFTQFKDISNTFTRKLADKVYQNTLIGTPFVQLEKELRQTINGIYSKAKDPEVKALVTTIKKDEIRLMKTKDTSKAYKTLKDKIDKNVATLQTKYATDRAGENMKRYAGQVLNDSLREFDAQLNLSKSIEAGLTMLQYQGSVVGTTRDHCRLVMNGTYDTREGGLFTIDEVEQLWASKSWSGKKPGNPLIVRGGYNCRHQWSFVNPDWYDKSGNLIIE